MADSLEERLRSHADSFNSLLSLIPAKNYVSPDTENQWKRKKQTKDEKHAAKRAKLNPYNHKSALELIEEQTQKRKREDDDDDDDNDAESKKMHDDSQLPDDGNVKASKRQRNQKKQKLQIDQGGSVNSATDLNVDTSSCSDGSDESVTKNSFEGTRQVEAVEDRGSTFNLPGVSDEKPMPPETRSISSEEHSDARFSLLHSPSTGPSDSSTELDNETMPSGNTSISSVQQEDTSTPPHHDTSSTHRAPATSQQFMKPETSNAELKARLQALIHKHRVARKADNEDGTAARTRQEFIDIRRKKEEQRKAQKKQRIRQAKSEGHREEEEALHFQGSPLISPIPKSPADLSNSLSFGRIAFENGQAMTANLDIILRQKKRKGPQDPQSALDAAIHREQKNAQFDDVEREVKQEKEMWLNARKRARGDPVKDDQSLLKKALKRKENQKKKSAKEWEQRLENQQKSQEMKQKRREENIQKRKEEKGKKGQKNVKKPASKPRPGFEGGFRAKPFGKRR